MAVTEVKNIKNEKTGELELNDSIFGVEVKQHIIHDIVRMQSWRQKGTGRARAGTNNSPIWRGGGVTFGPKPRDFSYRVPRKVRKLGICMALSSRLAEENLVVLDDIKMDEIKTKNFVGIMDALALDNALIVVDGANENLEKSSRNVPGYKVMPTAGLNVYDILLHKKIVLVQACLGQLEKRLLS
jgi:large subunit ribosomal protein L4